MLLEKAAKNKYFRPFAEDLEEYDPIQLYRELAGKMTQYDYAQSIGIDYDSFRRWWQGTSIPRNAVYFRRAYELRKRYVDRGWL
ncbi:MAG TPA: hypothetical protein VK211_08650 [Kamptonema sp.]|nr:hypothetical protein [Kamptonema sp.]